MTDEKLIATLKDRMERFSDFPKPGISFIDIFPLFTKPSLLQDIVDAFHKHITKEFQGTKIDAVLALDSRGFLFGPLLAMKLNTSFVPLRKKGKLPGEVVSESYALEYGNATVEMQVGSVKQGDNVIIIDDLLATGGTMAAACNIVLRSNARVLKSLCVVELTGLKGVAKLPSGIPFFSIVQYDS